MNSGTTKYYSTLKINELSSHEKMQKNLKCILLVKEANLKRLQYCMVPNTQIPENYGDSEKDQWLPGLRVERGKSMRSIDNF